MKHAFGIFAVLIFGGIPFSFFIVLLFTGLSVIIGFFALPLTLLLLAVALFAFFNPPSRLPRSDLAVALATSCFIWLFIISGILIYVGGAFGTRTWSGTNRRPVIDTSLTAPRPTNLIESSPLPSKAQ